MARAWDALSRGDLDAIGLGAAQAADDIPSGSTLRSSINRASINPLADDDHRPERRSAAAEALPPPALLLPGSFNPLHEGHRRMLRLAPTLTSRKGSLEIGSEGAKTPSAAYELSILNVDKPPLDAQEAAGRLAHFAPDDVLWLTRSATFSDKARLFPGATFAVGADTVVRIGDLRYYENAAARDEAIHALRTCRFLVFGRTTGNRFRTLSSLDLPTGLHRLCEEVGAEVFRIDLSSTSLRTRR